MKNDDELEINIPVPWSAEPVGIICRGWRGIIAIIVAAAATAAVIILVS